MNSLSKIFMFIFILFSVALNAQPAKKDSLIENKSDSLAASILHQPLNNFKPDIYLNEYEHKNENFTNSYLFKGLIAGAVALGVTAAYFKLKADNRFDQYKLTKEQSLLDDTRKFDWYSGISFSALQINLGFLIYYFLVE